LIADLVREKLPNTLDVQIDEKFRGLTEDFLGHAWKGL